MARPLMTSNDALSLDGLLDTVSSCGSFHSPPNSPLKNGRGGFRASGRFPPIRICKSLLWLHRIELVQVVIVIHMKKMRIVQPANITLYIGNFIQLLLRFSIWCNSSHLNLSSKSYPKRERSV